jgi:hypothetical protein
MKKHAFFLGLILAAAGTCGCARILMPLALMAIYTEGKGPIRESSVPIDPYVGVRGRWDEVMRLPAKSVVDVLTMEGTAHVGLLTRADARAVRILINGVDEQIARADVLRLDVLYFPGPEADAIVRRAAVVEAASAAAASVVAAMIGGQACVPPGALLRAVAIEGTAGGHASLAAQRGRLIYLPAVGVRRSALKTPS